jgi:hypothetical protein
MNDNGSDNENNDSENEFNSAGRRRYSSPPHFDEDSVIDKDDS